jgi:glutathione reductase (NADPH)
VVIGAGYIAAELAGIFGILGSDTSCVIRGDYILRHFDNLLYENVTNEMRNAGIKFHTNSQPKEVHPNVCNRLTTSKVKKQDNGKKSVILDNGTVLQDVDFVLCAIGRPASILQA